MKRLLIPITMLLTAAACNRNTDFDATGTFEATEVVVSAEANGRITAFDAEEGDTVEALEQVGAIDTVQLYLQKLQLQRSAASVRSTKPDISRQVSSLRERISKQQTGSSLFSPKSAPPHSGLSKSGYNKKRTV